MRVEFVCSSSSYLLMLALSSKLDTVYQELLKQIRYALVHKTVLLCIEFHVILCQIFCHFIIKVYSFVNYYSNSS